MRGSKELKNIAKKRSSLIDYAHYQGELKKKGHELKEYGGDSGDFDGIEITRIIAHLLSLTAVFVVGYIVFQSLGDILTTIPFNASFP